MDLESVAEHLEALWQDAFGRQVCGITIHVAHSIVADLRVVPDFFSQQSDTYKCLGVFSQGFQLVLASLSVDSDFKHFTCEIAGQLEWETKHHGKQTEWRRKANRKSTRVKAAGQKKAGMRRSVKASLTCQELQHIFD